MILKIATNDPFNILSSTKFVIEHAKHVQIQSNKLKDLLNPINLTIGKGLNEATASAGLFGDLKKDCQLVFIEDCVNFCFWAEKGKEKWQVEYPKGNIINGGWFGLEACFKKAIDTKFPVLSAKYLSDIKFGDVEKFFQSSNKVIIPLIEKRHENLKEAGRVLSEKYDGEFINFLEESFFDASKIVKNIVGNFSSFNDVSKYKGKDIYFFKRAQIVANDINIGLKKFGKKEIKGIEKLSAFADYKIPQVLRSFGILVYSDELAKDIDNYVLIPKDSEEEIEIRACNIWAVELIRQMIPEFSASEIDNALWLLSQDQAQFEKPYHRTYTIYY